MADPKLKRMSVTIRYGADDGYSSEVGFSSGARPGREGFTDPRFVLLAAIAELARLASLFGLGDDAIKRTTAAHQRVEDWRATRWPAAHAGERSDDDVVAWTPAPTEPAAPLKGCSANRDGDCVHAQCPQLRDGEPRKSGRHCPLDARGEPPDPFHFLDGDDEPAAEGGAA